MTLLEEYIRIADALHIPSDSPPEHIRKKAEWLWRERGRLYKTNMQLLEACKEARYYLKPLGGSYALHGEDKLGSERVRNKLKAAIAAAEGE